MVLEYWDITAEQRKLARQLGVRPEVGAPAGRIRRLASRTLRVIYDSGEWKTLADWLDDGVPLIAMVQAGELAQWRGESFQHAIVIVGYDAHHVQFLDPAAQAEVLEVSVDEFLLAWGEMDLKYAIIVPAERP